MLRKLFKGRNSIHRNKVSINFQKQSYILNSREEAVTLKNTISGGITAAAVLVYGCLACLKSTVAALAIKCFVKYNLISWGTLRYGHFLVNTWLKSINHKCYLLPPLTILVVTGHSEAFFSTLAKKSFLAKLFLH